MNELDVVGVRVEMPSNQPIVLLKESGGDRYLPIWIGAVEATAIAFAQQGVVPAAAADPRPDPGRARGRRPGAHPGAHHRRCATASSTPSWSSPAGVEVSARPSDAIALALRTGTPIFGAEEVLDEAGIAIPDEQEDEVEKFREFLDQISPEDFGPAGLTAA